MDKGAVTELVANGSAACKGPAHGCGESLVTNDVSEGRPQCPARNEQASRV